MVPLLWKFYEAPLPIGIERGRLVGPKLTTLIAYLKGVCHVSFSTILEFIRDVVRLTISRGQLSAIIAKVKRGWSSPTRNFWIVCWTKSV